MERKGAIMFKKILTVALVVSLSILLIAFLGCPKKEQKPTTTTEGGGTTTTTTTPPPPPPMNNPIQYVAPVETIIQTITTSTAIKQAASCLDAAANLLAGTGDETLIVLLSTKTLTLIDAIAPSYPASAAKFASASADLTSLINLAQAGPVPSAATWMATLKKHRDFLLGLITTTTVTTSDKKLSDFYSKDELDKMKLKFKEYGDNLKLKYKEMQGK
jgi:hypothetical protein